MPAQTPRQTSAHAWANPQGARWQPAGPCACRARARVAALHRAPRPAGTVRRLAVSTMLIRVRAGRAEFAPQTMRRPSGPCSGCFAMRVNLRAGDTDAPQRRRAPDSSVAAVPPKKHPTLPMLARTVMSDSRPATELLYARMMPARPAGVYFFPPSAPCRCTPVPGHAGCEQPGLPPAYGLPDSCRWHAMPRAQAAA